jgi:hypothetical protein
MVAVALIVVGAGVPVSAADRATLLGRVYGADGATPRADVVVAFVDEAGEVIYDSEPTDDRGVFRLDGAPAGSYTVVARAPEGDFLAGNRVALSSGTNPPVTLALLPAAASPENGDGDDDEGEDEGEGEGEGDDSQSPPPTVEQKEGLPTWAKWNIVGGLAFGGLGLIRWLGEDEDLGSPF